MTGRAYLLSVRALKSSSNYDCELAPLLLIAGAKNTTNQQQTTEKNEEQSTLPQQNAVSMYDLRACLCENVSNDIYQTTHQQ